MLPSPYFRLTSIVASSLLVSAMGSASLAQSTVRASVNTLGQGGNGPSYWVTHSGDGRYVAFTSEANNLAASDQNNTSDVFVRDLLTQETRCVSTNANGVPANNFSWGSTISQNGQFVAFYGRASDLVPGTERGVYVRNLTNNHITVVSVNSAGQHSGDLNVFWGRLSLSANGRFVCFDSESAGLVPNDTGAFRDVFVHDRDSDGNGVFDQPGGIKTVRISVNSSGEAGNGESRMPQMTANGRFVVFDSVASNLVPNDLNGKRDIFVHDRDSDADGVFDEIGGFQTFRASVNSLGAESNGVNTGWGTISGNGAFVAFHSDATTLVEDDTNGQFNVFLFSRPDGDTTMISRTPNGGVSLGDSALASLSEDGRFVAFLTFGNDILENDINSGADAVVHNRITGQTVLANITAGGKQAGAVGNFTQIGAPAISPKGRYVGFVTTANGVVLGDQNGLLDIYLRDRGPMRDADINANGVVDIDDLLEIVGQWGPCQQPCPPSCIADVFPPEGNCIVDIDDLLEVIGNWD